MTSFTWDRVAKRYRDAQGHFVPTAQVRAAIDDVIVSVREGIKPLAERLLQGDITLAQWQTEMMGITKDVQLLSVMAARGGVGGMTQSDYGKAGAYIKKQYGFLRELAGKLASGERPMDGRFAQSALRFAEAGRSTFERERLIVDKAGGATLGKRELQPGSHSCQDCIDLANMDWQPIEDVVPIGDPSVQCLDNCNCLIDTR